MPTIEITREHDTPTGWRFEVRITSRRGGSTTHKLTMSFQDYEVLCRGTRPPSDVAAELVERLVSGEIENAPKPLPVRFDAATATRWMAGHRGHPTNPDG